MHVVLSDQLVKEIDAPVGARQRSSFISDGVGRGRPHVGVLPGQRGGSVCRHVPERGATHRHLLRSLQLHPITFPVAELAGRLKHEYSRQGQTLSLLDTLVAAVAIHSRLTLITDKYKGFPDEGSDDLSVQRWSLDLLSQPGPTDPAGNGFRPWPASRRARHPSALPSPPT